MATTPTYSWPIPDDTDLVKDGAEAIRDLGNAIDTTVDGLPGAGLVHINTTSVSAVSAISFNDVFTSDYDVYRLILRLDSRSTSLEVRMRLRVSGADTTTTNYYTAFIGRFPSTTTSMDENAGTSYLIGSNNGVESVHTFDVSYPNKNLRTFINGTIFERNNTTAFAGGAQINIDTVYDGFTILASTGNITGIASIYGYAKA
jgi:hypothetical protein